MGANIAADPGRRRLEQRGQPGQRHDQDADARGRRGDRQRVPGRRQPGPDRLRPPPGRLRQQELGPDRHLRHHARTAPGPRLGSPGRGRAVHRRRTSTTSPWSACSARPSCTSCSSDESPIGKEVYVNDVPLRVIGVLSRKGTNIIGDRPGRHPARPLDDDQVPRQRRVVAPRDAARPTRTTRGRRSATLGRRYPRSVAPLYPTQSPTQMVDTPRLERFSNVDFDPGPRPVHRGDPRRDGPDHRAVARAAPARPRAGRRLRRSRTSPRSSRPWRRRSGSWRACWCAWP